MANGLTIGQAAAFVGVTIKTVRHYHRLGLVAEPERDGSGYRRYGSADLLRLIQARTLAGAGCTAGRDRRSAGRRSRAVRRRPGRRPSPPHRTDRGSDRTPRHAAPARPQRPGPAARPGLRDLGTTHRSRLLPRLRGRSARGSGAGSGTDSGDLRKLPDPPRTLAHRPRVHRADQAQLGCQILGPRRPADRGARVRGGRQSAGQPCAADDADRVPEPVRRRHPVRTGQPPPGRPGPLHRPVERPGRREPACGRLSISRISNALSGEGWTSVAAGWAPGWRSTLLPGDSTAARRVDRGVRATAAVSADASATSVGRRCG